MRTIYTFSLGDEVSQSMELLNKFKAFGYLLYDELMTYEMEEENQILCHDDIVYNELLESQHDGKYYYRFKYDNYASGMYEPFMIDDISFGFTVNSSESSDEKVMEAFKQIKRITNFNYDIDVNSFEYIPDEENNNRLETLNYILYCRGEEIINQGNHTKILKLVN